MNTKNAKDSTKNKTEEKQGTFFVLLKSYFY